MALLTPSDIKRYTGCGLGQLMTFDLPILLPPSVVSPYNPFLECKVEISPFNVSRITFPPKEEKRYSYVVLKNPRELGPDYEKLFEPDHVFGNENLIPINLHYGKLKELVEYVINFYDSIHGRVLDIQVDSDLPIRSRSEILEID